MRTLVAASAILATFLTTSLSLAAATPPPVTAAAPPPVTAPTDSDRATAALEYLLAAQRADGSIDGSLGETADFVIGAAATGYDPATLQGCAGGAGALSYLAVASDAAASDAAKTGKTILAVVAAGGDPTSFASRDLLARLAALYQDSTGAFGDGSTFSQSFAILAVAASGGAVPPAALVELAALQDSDGSWSYGTAPVAAGQGDTNSTAIALMALDAAGVHAADAAGLAYLSSQQLADGGFPYQNASVWGPPTSDPDSDSIVLQALVAAGQDPTAPGWSKGSNDVLTQLGSSQGTDGGFAYPGMGEDAFTTTQVPAALMRVPYAASVHPAAGASVPTGDCPGAGSSPSALASSSGTAGSSPISSPAETSKPTATATKRPKPAPTVRPTALPSPTAGLQSVESPAGSPTDSPAIPSPLVAPTISPSTPLALAAVAGATSRESGGSASPADSTGGVSAPLAYAAALAVMAAVVAGGWLRSTRLGKP
jgi:hypothetical protein